MDRRRVSWAAMIIGVIVLVISALADALRLGQLPGFGWKQTLGVVVGIVLIGAGWYWGKRPGSAR